MYNSWILSQKLSAKINQMSTFSEFADTLSFGLVHTIRKKTHLVKDHVQTTTTLNDRTSIKKTVNEKRASIQNFTLSRSHSTSSFIPSSLRCSKSYLIRETKEYSESVEKKTLSSTFPRNESNEKFQSVIPKRSLSLPINRKYNTKTILPSIKNNSKPMSVEKDISTININLKATIPSPEVKPEKKVTIFDQPIDLESGRKFDKISNYSVPSLIQDDDSVSLYSLNPEIQYKVVFADNIFPGYS